MAELHQLAVPALIVAPAGAHALCLDGRHVAIFNPGDVIVAARVAELLDRHGLVDVPDHPPAPACPWPPPTGEPR